VLCLPNGLEQEFNTLHAQREGWTCAMRCTTPQETTGNPSRSIRWFRTDKTDPPSVTRVFSKSRDMYVYLQAYEPGAPSTQPLVAFVTFYRGQTKAFETPPLPVSEGMDNKLKTVPLKFNFSLAQLQPRKYDCQVTVLDPTNRKAAFWQV
jgi:hypothetical protein